MRIYTYTQIKNFKMRIYAKKKVEEVMNEVKAQLFC